MSPVPQWPPSEPPGAVDPIDPRAAAPPCAAPPAGDRLDAGLEWAWARAWPWVGSREIRTTCWRVSAQERRRLSYEHASLDLGLGQDLGVEQHLQLPTQVGVQQVGAVGVDREPHPRLIEDPQRPAQVLQAGHSVGA